MKIKFIRDTGYYPYCIIGDTEYAISEHCGKTYYPWSFDSYRRKFALVSKPVHNPLRTWRFTNMDDATKFMMGICPGCKYQFSSGERSLYRNDEWEVIFTVVPSYRLISDIHDRVNKGIRRRDRNYHGIEDDLYAYRAEEYYEVSRRRAVKVIKDGMYDLQDAMDFAVKYLTDLLNKQRKTMQPELFD